MRTITLYIEKNSTNKHNYDVRHKDENGEEIAENLTARRLHILVERLVDDALDSLSKS